MRDLRSSGTSFKRLDQPWHLETKRLGPDLIITLMHGTANGDFAEEVLRQLKREQIGGQPSDWIPDACGIEKTEPSLFPIAKEVLREFKLNGGRDVVAIITRPMIVMAARTISFGSQLIGGATIEVVKTLDEAHRYLDARRPARSA